MSQKSLVNNPAVELALQNLGRIVQDWKTETDLQYALKGLLSEVSHLATNEYFDPVYVSEKARIIHLAMD